jgi:hypothetical protein
MSAPRLAAWIIGAAVCGAWLASAAGVSRQARETAPPPPAAEAVRFDTLAADVQAQAGRLKERLAEAPAPSTNRRNPFEFSSARVRRARPAASAPPPAPIDVPMEVREPVLELIGIAESTRPDGPVRTAMITGGHGDLMMVVAGQRILGRYDVVAVGADAVELRDVETAAVRRLILR